MHLSKGQLVDVVGRLQTRQWYDDAGKRHFDSVSRWIAGLALKFASTAIFGQSCPVSRARLVVVFAFFLLTGCGALLAQEAPAACGFPDGTALSHAGRSTTAALDI